MIGSHFEPELAHLRPARSVTVIWMSEAMGGTIPRTEVARERGRVLELDDAARRRVAPRAWADRRRSCRSGAAQGRPAHRRGGRRTGGRDARGPARDDYHG